MRMSRDKLPTEEDLRRLYDERGHRALITYAYRNALRALPILAMGRELTEVWRENTVQHCYGVVRGLLLIQWIRQQNNNFTIEEPTSQMFYNATLASVEASSDALEFDDTSISYASSISSFATSYLYSFSFSDVVSSANVFYAHSYACNDFDYLQQGKSLPPIWYDNKPQEVRSLEKDLITQLQDLELDFLVNDIKCLWEDKPLGKHAINYTKMYSETITNNAEFLKSVIFGEIQTEKLTATRVLLLGAGGAGKTTLADRLNHKKPTNENKSATKGIEYHAIDLTPFGIAQEIRDNLQLYLWDFGGQSIFHGLHNAFLHENCVYIIVVDSRHEQAPDEWLYQIQNIVGDKKPPVLIVTNIYENCNLQQNKTRLLREFDDLLTENSFYYFPCNNPQENHQKEFDNFINQLVILALKNQRDIFSDMITIKNSMAKVFQDDVFISQNQLINHIKTLPLNTPVKENKVEDLMEILRSLGFIVRLKEVNKNEIEQYCLEPEWTVDKAYTLLDKLREKESNGLATVNEIDKLIGIETSNNTQKLLDFFIDRKLCYPVGQDENKQYFFPDASSTYESKEVNEIIKKTDRLQIRFNLKYMPLGLHAYLVSKFFDFKEIKIQSPQDVWREGFIIKDKNVQAVISYYYRKSYIDFTFTGDIKHAGAIFKELHKEIASYLKIELKEPTKKNIFQKISAFFNKKHKGNDNTQANIIILSIISNDNKLTRTFSELPKLSYKDLRTAEKLEKMKIKRLFNITLNFVNVVIVGVIINIIWFYLKPYFVMYINSFK